MKSYEDNLSEISKLECQKDSIYKKHAILIHDFNEEYKHNFKIEDCKESLKNFRRDSLKIKNRINQLEIQIFSKRQELSEFNKVKDEFLNWNKKFPENK